jgi:type I restriction enzyme S subunit
LKSIKPQLLSIVDLAGHGTGRLNTDSLKKIQVSVPDSEIQQQKIAAILSSLDDKIELNRAMNETLEQIAQALFKSWFVDFDPVHAKAAGLKPVGMDAATAALFPDSFEESELGPIPKGWEVKTMADLAEIVGGSTPSTKEDSYWTEGCYNWSTPKDLSNNTDKILLTTERRITGEGLKTISSGLLPEGTILMSSRAPVGYLAVAKIPVAINQGYIAMKSNAENFNLYLLLYCESIMSEIKQKAGGTTFAEISKKVFRDILILNPPNKIMQLFHEIVGSIYTKKTTNKSESMRIEQIRDSLLPKLLSGEIRVDARAGSV